MEKNFRIWQTTKEAFGFVNHHCQGWLKVASGPFLIMLAVIVFVMMMGGVTEHAINGGINLAAFHTGSFTFAVALIGSIIAHLMFTVSAYRFAMYREGGMKWFEFRFDHFMGKVFLYYLAVGLIFALIGGVGGGSIVLAAASGLPLVSWVLGLLLFLALAYLGLRLIFVILFAASGIENPIKSSFEISKDHVLKLLGISIVLGLLFFLLSFGIMFVFGLIAGILSASQLILLQFLAACIVLVTQALLTLYTHVVVMSAFVLVYNKIAK